MKLYLSINVLGSSLFQWSTFLGNSVSFLSPGPQIIIWMVFLPFYHLFLYSLSLSPFCCLFHTCVIPKPCHCLCQNFYFFIIVFVCFRTFKCEPILSVYLKTRAKAYFHHVISKSFAKRIQRLFRVKSQFQSSLRVKI